MKKEKSKAVRSQSKHLKRFKKFILIVFLIILAYVIITTALTLIGLKSNSNLAKSVKEINYESHPVFKNYDNGCWNIISDGDIKIVQLTDVHIGGGYLSTKKDAMAINAVASMLSAEKPDFVIVTGDISYPVPFQAGTFNNKSAAKLFAELMESLGVYWTACYGNHDTEIYSYYSREKLTEFYSSGNYPHCLLQAGPENVDGSGNQVFNIVNSDGIITRSLVIFDSHSYVDGDYFGIKWKYDNIHENQIEWYKNTITSLSAKNAEVISKLDKEKAEQYKDLSTVKSSAFLHIPLEEYKTAWLEYVDNGYNDTENVKYNYGTVGESGKFVYCGIHKDNLFETMLELNSTDSVFCGHDHLNNFSLNYKGINLNYGMSVDYLAYIGIYKLGAQRGCCVLNIDALGELTANNQNYYQDKYIAKCNAKEDVTLQVLNENAK